MQRRTDKSRGLGFTTWRRNLTALGLLTLAILLVTPVAAQVEPVGGEILVNTPTGSGTFKASVAIDDLGQFLVVWSSDIPGGDREIMARRFDAQGLPMGGEFMVNSYTTQDQYRPEIARRSNGDFVVVWQSRGSAGTDTDFTSVQGRLLAADGSPMGTDFQVNSYTPGAQDLPLLATHPDGGFLVVWSSFGSQGNDDFGRSVQGQLFDALGSPTGAEFQVNDFTTSNQQRPEAAPVGDGFVVTWYSDGSPGNDNDDDSIQARFVDGTGPIGSDFQVNTYTTGAQNSSTVVSGPGDQFVVLFSSDGPAGIDDFSLQARRFDTDGSPMGGQFQVNTYTTGAQDRVSAVATAGDELIVVWTSGNAFGDGIDGDEAGISLQTLDASGSPVGDELQVNTTTANDQENPQVATNGNGDVVVVWTSEIAFPDVEVRVQRFNDPNAGLFADGFESGDTQAWSSTSGER